MIGVSKILVGQTNPNLLRRSGGTLLSRVAIATTQTVKPHWELVSKEALAAEKADILIKADMITSLLLPKYNA